MEISTYEFRSKYAFKRRRQNIERCLDKVIFSGSVKEIPREQQTIGKKLQEKGIRFCIIGENK